VTTRALATRTLPSACPLDCPDHCGLSVEVEDGRVVRVGARDEGNPLTAGFICGKVARFQDHVHGPDRLLHPAVRRPGARKRGGDPAAFERVSWDQALALVAARLDEARTRHGGESILPLSYGGSNGYLTQDTLDARLFRRLGASRCLRTVCAAPSGAAATGLYGKMPGVALPDFEHASLVVLWGVNPSASGIHLVPVLDRARERGAKLVVIDPRRTPLARRAHLHLAVRPGSDLPLALSVIRFLFESGGADARFLARHATGAGTLRKRAEFWTFARAARACGVAAGEIERFAQLYAESSPAVVRAGWGLERNRNGGSAVAAVLALPAVAGKFGVRGGGYTLSNGGAWRLTTDRAAAEPESGARAVNMNRVGEALLSARDPRIEALFVYNMNPLATLPAQGKVRAGLERDDLFTVAFDQVMTDTARHADVLLPATTFLEHAELRRGYGAMTLRRTAPVIPPVGEARSNVAVFGELCRRLGLARPGEPETDEEIARAILSTAPGGRDLAAELAASDAVPPDCGASPVQFADSFPLTADGKIHLVPEALERSSPLGLYRFQDDPSCEKFPLALVSPASSRLVNSSLGELVKEKAAVEIHPADAAARGIGQGDSVRVFNDLGEVHCRARVTELVREGVVALSKGLWSRHTDNGATANALCPDTLTDLGGGACFNDARVEVARRG